MYNLKRITCLFCVLLIAFGSMVNVNAETVVTLDGYSYTINDNGMAVLVGWNNSSDTLYVPRKIGNVYVSEIGDSAFKNDSFIKHLDLSDAHRMYTIGKYAFANSILEDQLIIPTRVTSVGVAAFEGCANITSLQFSSDGGIVPSQCFNNCTSLETVVLTDYIESINAYAFKNCTSLKEVTIPSSVTDINSNAFNGCGEFVIKGYRDSYAQQFAKDKGLDFYILDPLYGDSNADGKVNILDVTAIQKYKIGEQELSEYGMRCADVNHDGSITVRDATLIQMKLAKYDVNF